MMAHYIRFTALGLVLAGSATVLAFGCSRSEEAPPAPAAKPGDERRAEAIDLIVGTVEALASERGGDDKVWGSMVKQALKRVRPGFAESYYGFRSFNAMLEAARDAGALALERDEKSGGYAVRVTSRED